MKQNIFYRICTACDSSEYLINSPGNSFIKRQVVSSPASIQICPRPYCCETARLTEGNMLLKAVKMLFLYSFIKATAHLSFEEAGSQTKA